MAQDNLDPKRAQTTAHISHALVDALLIELEKETPGLRKRVWEQAQRSLDEYDLLDENSSNWVAWKIADL